MIKFVLTVVLLSITATAQSIGVPGQPKPIKSEQIAGNDGTTLRTLKTDANGQLLTTTSGLANGSGVTQPVSVAIQPTVLAPSQGSILGNVKQIGSTVYYSATALGANGVALPASPTEVLLNKVDLTGVRQFNIISNCGQIYAIKAKIYAPDGTTNLLTTTSTMFATIGASFESMGFVGSDSTAESNGGTLSGKWRLPLGVVQFALLNSTATPTTCTVSLLASY